MTFTPKFKIWKTLELGRDMKDINDYNKAFKAKGMKISDWANDILKKPAFTIAVKKTEVDLTIVTVTQLGFKDGANLKDIYAQAEKLGLKLCPNEIGPALRLEYPDQPKGEWLFVAMKSITDTGDGLRIFSVVHDEDGLLLGSPYENIDNVWDGNHRFIFVIPHK